MINWERPWPSSIPRNSAINRKIPGAHPQANVEHHQCPNLLYRRMIEHSHPSNIHVHVGAPPATPRYPYWVHCTGDIRRDFSRRRG